MRQMQIDCMLLPVRRCCLWQSSECLSTESKRQTCAKAMLRQGSHGGLSLLSNSCDDH